MATSQVIEPAPPAGPPARRAGRGRRSLPLTVAQFLVLAVPVVFLGAMVWKYRTIYDDGFINLHVVQQVLAGHGLVFNQGQRVEAFTSPLWLFILLFFAVVTPFPLVWVAVVLGIVFTLGGVTLAMVASARLFRRRSPRAFLLPLGALILMALFPLWTLATTGLETGLTCLWVGTCLFLLVRWSATGTGVPWYTAVVLGLGPLVRPELLLDSLVFLGALLFLQRATQRWPDRVRLVLLMAALPFLYQVFRMGYYGELVSNTAIAKEASSFRVGLGVRYLWNFVEPYWLLVPLIAVAAGAYLPLAASFRQRGDDRSFWVLLAFPIAGVLNAGYITAVGGDYMHARLLLPATFAVFLPVSVVPVARRYAISLVVVPWAIACAVALRPPFAWPTVGPFWLRTQPRGVTLAQFGWAPGDPARSWYTGPGLYYQNTTYTVPVRLDVPAAPGERLPQVALSAIGLISYAFGPGFNVVDEYGLAEPIDAHFALAHRGLTGHEKPLPTDWLIALMTAPGSSEQQIDQLQRSPANVRLTNPQQAPLVTGHALEVQVAWARATLQCPAIRSFVHSYTAPMTVGLFFSNIVHAFSRTSLTIPPDPEQAYHKFCGPGTPGSVRAAIRGSP